MQKLQLKMSVCDGERGEPRTRLPCNHSPRPHPPETRDDALRVCRTNEEPHVGRPPRAQAKGCMSSYATHAARRAGIRPTPLSPAAAAVAVKPQQSGFD